MTNVKCVMSYDRNNKIELTFRNNIRSTYASFETFLKWWPRGRHRLNADNTYAVASCRYISSKCVRERWWFVVISLHVIRGPSSRVVTRVIMRRRIHGHVIRWAVILKLPDDHKTVPIGIYHLGAYYRRVNPGGWKQRRVKGPMSRKLDDNFTQASHGSHVKSLIIELYLRFLFF